MNKNILTYKFILIALFMLPGTISATDASKNRLSKEKTPIKLQGDQSQQQTTPKKMGRTKVADKFSDNLDEALLTRVAMRGGM